VEGAKKLAPKPASHILTAVFPEPHDGWEDKTHWGETDGAGQCQDVIEHWDGRGEDEGKKAKQSVESEPRSPVLPRVLLEMARVPQNTNESVLCCTVVENSSADNKTGKCDS
jgi:hypothetical protein